MREQWLAMIERRRSDYEAMDTATNAYEQGRAVIQAWDGWTMRDGLA